MNRRERVMVIVAATCVGLLIADWIVVEPLIGLWKSHAQAIVTLQGKIDRADRLIRNEQSIRADWNDMRGRSLTSDQSKAGSEVVDALGDWAIASRLSVSSVRTRWVPSDDDNRLEVRVTAGGDIASVTRFLYEIERTRMAINLEDVEIRSRDDNGSQLELEARFTGLVLPEARAKTSKDRASEAKKS
jgi:hypothetical protein